MRVTRTPLPAHSALIDWLSAVTAHLVAEYKLPIRTPRPATDPVRTRCPPARTRAGSAARGRERRAEDIGENGLTPFLRLGTVRAKEGRIRTDAGISEGHVQPPESTLCGGDEIPHLRPLRDIAGDRQDLRRRRQPPSHIFQRLLAATGQDQGKTGFRRQACGGRSDSAATAGDQEDWL